MRSAVRKRCRNHQSDNSFEPYNRYLPSDYLRHLGAPAGEPHNRQLYDRAEGEASPDRGVALGLVAS
jgi:hypothetical protein